MTLELATTIRPVVENVCLPPSVIQAVVHEIARQLQPDKIILFGSYAYGTPRPWSDVDLLVVSDSNKDPIEAGLEIRQSLPRYHFSLDILVRSQAEIDRRLTANDFFIKEIIAKGKLLYERRTDSGGVDSQG